MTIRLVLVLLGALGLGGTAELLGAVLPLLALLSAGLLDLCASTDADQTVEGLELLQGLLGVVDESEASALTTTVLRTETEDGDLVLVGLVQVGELVAELVLGDVGAVGVEDIPVGKENQSSACRLFLCWFAPYPGCLSNMSEFQ